jgi:hypothetical protein
MTDPTLEEIERNRQEAYTEICRFMQSNNDVLFPELINWAEKSRAEYCVPCCGTEDGDLSLGDWNKGGEYYCQNKPCPKKKFSVSDFHVHLDGDDSFSVGDYDESVRNNHMVMCLGTRKEGKDSIHCECITPEKLSAREMINLRNKFTSAANIERKLQKIIDNSGPPDDNLVKQYTVIRRAVLANEKLHTPCAKETFDVYCAWCGKLTGTKERQGMDLPGPSRGGMCKECFDKQMGIVK